MRHSTTQPWTGPVPLLDLEGHHRALGGEIAQAIDRVLRSGRYILGPEVEALEADIAAYSGASHGVGVSSGTDALLVSLMACGIGPGDEVITTPFTFFATAGVIARVGARPVFVDIDEETFNLDPDAVRAAVTSQTRAIIPVHLYGQMADIPALKKISESHDLYVIEDAAQAIGAEFDGIRAGALGHLGCLSFFPSKNLGALGDGGMVVSNDFALADKVRLLRTHGYRPKYYNSVVGGNFRLDALQAAVVRAKLVYLDEATRQRQKNAAIYRECFALFSSENASSVQEMITLPAERPPSRHVYNQFVIRTKRRDAVRARLSAQNIASEVYYPVPMHLQTCFAHLGYRAGDFPHAEAAANEVLALPIYPELTRPMIERVVSTLVEFYQESA